MKRESSIEIQNEALGGNQMSAATTSTSGGDTSTILGAINIASVSYLNSVPFNYGISHSGFLDAELVLLPPAECTEQFVKGAVDVALVPVGALNVIESSGVEFDIVTSHCIGADGAVRTVVLLSDEQPSDIKRIWLDTHSQTSVKLIAHLCEHHFKISPKWLVLSDMSRLEHPEDGDAFLLIGDKVFDHEGIFEYSYDLAQEWQDCTSLPFVFAVWCARKGVNEEQLQNLEEALEWGVERTYEALCELRSDFDVEDGYRYLTECIDTPLDNRKQEAMRLFRASGSRIELSIEP